MLALAVSALTFYYARWNKGTVEMTQPMSIYLQPGGSLQGSEIVMAALIHNTADQGKYIENVYIRLYREEGVQNFTECRYEDKGLLRPGAFFADRQGLATSFHFGSPGYGAWYDFLPGDYVLRVYVKCSLDEEVLIREERFSVTPELFRQMRRRKVGIWFIWSPDSRSYIGHVGAAVPSRPG